MLQTIFSLNQQLTKQKDREKEFLHEIEKELELIQTEKCLDLSLLINKIERRINGT